MLQEETDLGSAFEDPERESQLVEELSRAETNETRLRRSVLESSHNDHLKNSIEGLKLSEIELGEELIYSFECVLCDCINLTKVPQITCKVIMTNFKIVLKHEELHYVD